MKNEKVKSILHAGKSFVFVKSPDQYKVFVIKQYPVSGTYLMETTTTDLNNWKLKIPNGEYEIIGESHSITEAKMNEIGFTYTQYLSVMSDNDITYNYSAWTGKWIMLLKLQIKI